jgi:hypothetical protein
VDEEARFEGDPGEECVPVHGKWPIQGFCDPGVKNPICGAFAKARKIFVTAGRGEKPEPRRIPRSPPVGRVVGREGFEPSKA